MIPLTLISNKITNLLLPTYSSPIGKVFQEERQSNATNEVVPEQVLFSNWEPIEFVKKNGYWKAYITAPEISTDILSHSRVMIYNRLEDIVSKVADYTDEDFGHSILWIDHCLLPQKILLISNYDQSTSYRYVIIPDEAENRLNIPPPNYKNYYAVCDYYGIAELNLEITF